jgi:hypothetical protein
MSNAEEKIMESQLAEDLSLLLDKEKENTSKPKYSSLKSREPSKSSGDGPRLKLDFENPKFFDEQALKESGEKILASLRKNVDSLNQSKSYNKEKVAQKEVTDKRNNVMENSKPEYKNEAMEIDKEVPDPAIKRPQNIKKILGYGDFAGLSLEEAINRRVKENSNEPSAIIKNKISSISSELEQLQESFKAIRATEEIRISGIHDKADQEVEVLRNQVSDLLDQVKALNGQITLIEEKRNIDVESTRKYYGEQMDSIETLIGAQTESLHMLRSKK